MAADFRDPRTAWTAEEQAQFLCLYALIWAAVVLAVRFRKAAYGRWAAATSLLRKCRPCGCVRVARARVAAGMAEPLLAAAGEVAAAETRAGPETPYPSHRRVLELFDDRAREAPQRTALVVPDGPRGRREVSYGELSRMVDEVARHLNAVGVGRGKVVALILHRSVAQVAAVLGVLKSGAAFLPIDPEAPAARKRHVVLDAEAEAVVGERADADAVALAADLGIALLSLPADCAPGDAELRPVTTLEVAEYERPEESDLALLIYTSGTTGQPKGIKYDHRHLLHGLFFFGAQCGVDRESVALLRSPYFWAVIEWELFPALVSGGRLVVSSPAGHKSPEYLAKVCREEGVTVLMITPSVLDLVLDIHQAQADSAPLQSARHIVTVGEALPTALANRSVRTPRLGAAVHNFYGASESSCTIYTVPRSGVDTELFPNKAPCGRPQPHATVFVMRESASALVPVPTGDAGEICFGGVSAAGYWKKEELTREKWVDTEHGRLYRTGDMGRWRGGVLEVIGRTDRQVKIRGVRVEPEEVEMVLRRFEAPPQDADLEASSALSGVAVVASAEPAELVAFVSPRTGASAGAVTAAALEAHCRASLTPAYVPKFFVVLPEGLPSLPNGKPNLGKLRELAAKHAAEEGEMVVDSLGQMKKLSQWAILENAVIHRCYAYWMIGVMLDHWTRCAMDTDATGRLLPYCTTLARASVPPWAELLIRSFGNDQDLFGFILLGAYQDSRPSSSGGKPRVNLSLKDLFVFGVYLAMALPIAQILHLIFGSVAWPSSWGAQPAPTGEWDWSYMRVNSWTSDHRWYLLMVLQARVFMALGERLRVPGWMQTLLVFIPCVLPSSFLGETALDVCAAGSTAPVPLQYAMAFVFRSFGDGCPVFQRWVQWYIFFYVWAFHFIRPVVSRVSGILPKGPAWGAAAVGTSMTVGVAMALYHYPNGCLETGTGLQWAPLELGVDFVQPSLFALGMVYLPVNLAFWGNTTLGCYVFHFYFGDAAGAAMMRFCGWVSWDATGLLAFAGLVGFCVLFASVGGPVGHQLLIAPQQLAQRAQRALASRRRAAFADVPPSAKTTLNLSAATPYKAQNPSGASTPTTAPSTP